MMFIKDINGTLWNTARIERFIPLRNGLFAGQLLDGESDVGFMPRFRKTDVQRVLNAHE